MRCIYCSRKSIKKGISNAGKQRYRCKHCKRYFQARYTKPAITPEQDHWIRRFNNEGCGISNIARLLHITQRTAEHTPFG